MPPSPTPLSQEGEEGNEQKPLLLKVVLQGLPGAGKTSIMNRYISGTWAERFKCTFGADFKVKRFDVQGRDVCLQVWDLGGPGGLLLVLVNVSRVY